MSRIGIELGPITAVKEVLGRMGFWGVATLGAVAAVATGVGVEALPDASTQLSKEGIPPRDLACDTAELGGNQNGRIDQGSHEELCAVLDFYE